MLQTNYLGRIDFGTGAINATEVTEEFFRSQLDLVKSSALVRVELFRNLFGICMDGRDVIEDEAGNLATFRPEVMGGPSGFAWYIAAIGGFPLLKPGMSPVEQFITVNRHLKAAGFGLGMHHACGAAQATQPVVERYGQQYEAINAHIGLEARRIIKANAGQQSSLILRGIDQTHTNLVNRGGDFTEEAMHAVVRELEGPAAIVHLNQGVVDHPTHGHEEHGLLFLDVEDAVVDKSKLTGQFFIQNRAYARQIIEALASGDSELKQRGLVIADQLPIAAVSVLGTAQHVGEVSGTLLQAA